MLRLIEFAMIAGLFFTYVIPVHVSVTEQHNARGAVIVIHAERVSK